MISVLLATTGRPEMAKRCVQGIWDTTKGHDVEIVAAVDNDQVTVRLLMDLGCVVDARVQYRGCSKAWNDALSASHGDPVVLAADDLVWQPGWLDAALETLSEFPDGWGMVGFNDGHWVGYIDVATHYLMSKRFIREVFGGVVAWENYKHSFNDAEANERARMAGRYAWCEDAKVYHSHWLFGDRNQDETDTKNLGGHPESHQMFLQRQAAGFPNDYEPVI